MNYGMKRTKFFPVTAHNVWDKGSIKKTGIQWHELVDEVDGWLNSLHYHREIPEEQFVLYDCGGWTYREMEIPPIDSKSISVTYKEKCNAGSFVIAPDHMLIPGVDFDFRRKWNYEQAQRFIDDCPDELIPMAAVHGMSIEERVTKAQELIDLGYKHLAVGGIAGRSTESKFIIDLVTAVRKEVPSDTWVHVLGITSIPYYKEWCRIGIDSVDGSSYLQKALFGVYTYYENGRLEEYDCSQPLDEPKEDFLIHVESECQAPPCDCAACLILGEHNIDPRYHPNLKEEEKFRSEKKYGRAYHNLNHQMRAQKDTYKKLKKDNENK
tara:strand:- start:15 stop:986 length:972 start_codon:yes stop_codon:yes gene_type:complete